MDDKELRVKLSNLMHSTTDINQHTEIYGEVVSYFLRVSYAQFRRDILTKFSVQKKKALRKEIKVKRIKTGTFIFILIISGQGIHTTRI